MTLELYPASAHDAFHGKSIQYPRHIDEAVQQIHGACKGMGTDEQTLITVLGSKSPETRNLIALRYKELYHEPLHNLLKSETSGDFGRLLRMISTPLPTTEAQILRDATKGIGTTESLIVQILSGRTNEEINILKRAYFDLVGKDLAVTLNSELSGDFRKVVMAVLQAPRVPYNPAVFNAAKAEEEAVALYKAGQGRLGTNEEVFIGILVKAPPEFLKMVDTVYVAKYNNNIAKAVDKEFSGDAKKSLNYLVRSTIDPYPTIAEVFEKTMKGFGTDETGLSTTLVRYQCVLPYVKAAYKTQYREELRDRISNETSGDYKKLLLEVFDAPHDPPKAKTKGVGTVSSGAGVAAPTVPSAPACSMAQMSYAASNSSLHTSAQGYGATPYTARASQQEYDVPQSVPSQPSFRAVSRHAPHQTVLGESLPQASAPQSSEYLPSGNNYPSLNQTQGSTPSYPSPQSGYPPQQQHQQHHQQQPGYPSPQPGYPMQQQQQPSYPQPSSFSHQPQQTGHPLQQQSGYLQQPPSGYPAQQPSSGYPAQQSPSGYPAQQPPSGYPPQQPPSGYPAQQPSPGYPAQQPPSGYPPQQPPSGYPAQQTTLSPQQQQRSNYLSQQSSYPSQQTCYPSPHPGYPAHSLPQQPSYPSQQPGYSHQQQPSYAPQQPGYVPSQPYQQYPAAGQQPPNQAYQQYPPPGQPVYPSPYGTAPVHGSYPVPHGGNYAPGGF